MRVLKYALFALMFLIPLSAQANDRGSSAQFGVSVAVHDSNWNGRGGYRNDRWRHDHDGDRGRRGWRDDRDWDHDHWRGRRNYYRGADCYRVRDYYYGWRTVCRDRRGRW